MKLSAWMKQDHNRLEELELILTLTSAIERDHQNGKFHGTLEPAEIEIEGSDCRFGAPDPILGENPLYLAPERSSVDPATQKGDVFSAGVIFYEALSKKHPADSGTGATTPLRQVRPDLDVDLADAITACTEKDPEWRPGDLTYVHEVARRLFAAAGGSGPAAAAPAKVAPAPAAPAPTPQYTSLPSLSGPEPTRREKKPGSPLPMILGGIVIAIGAGVSAWMFASKEATPAATPVTTTAVARTDAPAKEPPAADETQDPLAAPGGASDAPPPTTVAAAPVTTLPAAPVTTAPAAAAPTPPPTTVPPPPTTAAAAPPSTQPPPTTAPPVTAAPAPLGPPPVIKAISPTSAKRGAAAVIDVHGENLSGDQVPTITDAKSGAVAAGVRVMGKRLTRANLLQVSIRVEAAAPAGTYSFSVVSAAGQSSNSVLLKID